MLFFKNDYGQGCIPEILELLSQVNDLNINGYGMDPYCEKAKQLIQSKMPDTPVDVHFITGGTLTNETMIKHVLRSFQGVISADTGHINVHEVGAVEATGHKVISIKNANGKLKAQDIKNCFEEHMLTYEHLVYPKLVYISNATELGTVYTRKELEEIRAVCDELGLYLMMDGARIGCALMSKGIEYTLNDIAKWCDLFYIGGTKNGALMGEAVVISNPELKPFFRFNLKQTGAMMAKGWLLGIQFIGLFENDAFYECAKHSNLLAAKIQDYLVELKYPLFMRSDTNQIFPVVTKKQLDYLMTEVDFEVWEDRGDSIVIRFVTSFHTTDEEVQHLCQKLKVAANIE